VQNRSLISLLKIWIIVAFLTACGPREPAPLPVSDVNSIIVQTAAAAQTQTAVSLPTATTTLTPTIAPTGEYGFLIETPSFAIETLDPSLKTESVQYGYLPVKPKYDFEYSKYDWSCVGVGRYPPKGQVMRAGKPFVATWTVVNNGQRDWTQNTIDFVYKSGYRHTGFRIQDLDRYISSGRDITLYVDFIAPKTPGTYYAVWQLKVGKNGFCGIQFEFRVVDEKKKN